MKKLLKWILPVFCPVFLTTIAIFGAIPCAAQAAAQALPSRITGIIDESSLVTLRGNIAPIAQPSFDRGLAPASMPANRLILVLKRSAQQEADLRTYLESVQNPNSPNYRKFLTPAEFGARFGVDDADLQTVQTWLSGHGFKIDKISKGRMAIELSGTAGQVDEAFHTSLHSYVVNGKQYWANATDPQIPTALAPIIAGMASLNSMRPRAQYIRGPSGVYDPSTHTIKPTYTIGNTSEGYYIFLGPADAATIYDTPTTFNPNHTGTTYDGTGVTIGIAGDSNIDLTQNANYRSTFGLPANATTVTVDGTDPGENGDAVEAYLDTQVAGGIAPNAKIILYTAADTSFQSGLFLAITRAIDDNQADILNVSFGGCEAAFGSAGNQYVSELWEQAAAQGISVTVSTGDSGSAGCDNPNTEQAAQDGLAVNAIASSPYDIAVGGTDYDALYGNFPTSFTQYVDITNTLANHRSALKYIPEEPWNDSTYPNTSISTNINYGTYQGGFNNIIAGSGGVSAFYSAPNWQSGFGSATGRNLPDVSFLAGNGFYGAVWGICTDFDTDANGNPIADCAAGATGNSFNLSGFGGTSAAAPAFAGMLALAKQKAGTRLGQADYVLYDLAKTKYSTVFHDVTTGDNSVYCSTGSPNCVLDTAGYYFLSGYNATTGYDNASGLGSVDASQMVSNWTAPALVSTTSALKLNGATSALNITHGQSVTVSDTVTGSGGTPTGSIALVDNLSAATMPNNEGIAAFALSSGVASGTTTYLPGGSYQVSAHYGGSSTFAESDSNAIPVTVGAEDSTTNLTVSGYYDPLTGNQLSTPYYGSIFLIDAQPYGSSSSLANPDGAATGTITFKNGTATLGTATLSSEGIAELQTTALPGGSNSLTAVFPGDASFKASTSSPLSFTVQPMATMTLMSASTSSINLGGSVTLTAKLVSANNISTLDSDGAAPTGTVTFTDGTSTGTTTLGTVALSGTAGTLTSLATGSATYTTTQLGAGSHAITATYNGDANYAASQLTNDAYVSVSGATASMTLTPASSTVKVNQPLQISVTLAASGTYPTPTGTVTITAEGSYLLYTSPATQVVNGAVSITIPANTLALGQVTIAATYSGDKYYNSNNAGVQIQVTSSGTITPTVTMAAPTGVVMTVPVSVTITVSGPSGDPVPTGTVSLPVNTEPNTMPLTNGSAVFSLYGFVAGANSLTATYLGDSNYAAGTAAGTVDFIATPTMTFTPTAPSTDVNQAVTFTVTINGVSGVATPTGSVTISLQGGGYASSPMQLTAGSATFTIPANSLPVGPDSITVSYSGDTNYLPDINGLVIIVNPAPTPGLSISGTAVPAFTPGATTGNISTITVTPSGGFTGSVALTAALTSSPTGVQYPPTFSFGTTSPVSITGATAGTATLTISTTAPSSAALHRPDRPGARWLGDGAALACILLFGISSRRRRWQTLVGLLVFLVFLSGGVLSCGGGGSSGGGGGGGGTSGTSPGTYTVTVTGTSGNVTANGTVTFTVN